MAVNRRREREVIGESEGMKEDKDSWLSFLRQLKTRMLAGTRYSMGISV
jgi:putative transposase